MTLIMPRLPEKHIWATIDSMHRDLDKAYAEMKELLPADIPGDHEKYVLALVKIHTLSNEIIRWLVL